MDNSISMRSVGTNSTETNLSSNWVKPNDLMKARKLKARSKALKARMNTSINSSPKLENSRLDELLKEKSPGGMKRRNPFKCSPVKYIKLNHENSVSENSDDSLFNLFDAKPKNEQHSGNSCNFPNQVLDAKQLPYKPNGSNTLHIDWSLKSRIRFYSPKPFHWKNTFKTSEEASGTTGFVRCLNSIDAEGVRTVDTSANAQFYQCCLYWQHPSLPLISLFPRDKQKVSSHTGIYASDPLSTSLHIEWSEGLRSLYQLLRVRQCPFFYVCGPNFTCLFRATGAAGFPHTHALISPTTKGFRDAMKRDGVEFSMPLHDKSNEMDDDEQSPESMTIFKEAELEEEHKQESQDFLETLGLETSQIPGLNDSRTKVDYKKLALDGSPKSLVYVGDMELQGLINFILNCGSCVSVTGPLAGIPPTLLAPVGFHGGTLKSLKISANVVRTPAGEKQYAIDLQGAILPNAVLQLCSLLASSTDKFSASLTPLISTIPFTTTSPSLVGSPMAMAFANEGLVDCGLPVDIRTMLCKSSDELREKDLTLNYREIKYENCRYFCS